MQPVVSTTVIAASPPIVWPYLTEPGLMKKWMGEPEMGLEIDTDWTIGNPIVIRGNHHGKFENRGVVLEFQPCEIVSYTHLSSISRLSDVPEHHAVITLRLAPRGHETLLTTHVDGFANESIYKHLNLYWLTTPEVIKKLVESSSQLTS
jgi:uncharacterized protein YndB with AHSA1/START domain